MFSFLLDFSKHKTDFFFPKPQNISPEQLKEMSAASGMDMSDEQAEQTAKMMQKISPKTMQRMMAAGTFLQSAIVFVRKNKILVSVVVIGGTAVSVSWIYRRWFGSNDDEFDLAEAMGRAGAAAGGGDPWAQGNEF